MECSKNTFSMIQAKCLLLNTFSMTQAKCLLLKTALFQFKILQRVLNLRDFFKIYETFLKTQKPLVLLWKQFSKMMMASCNTEFFTPGRRLPKDIVLSCRQSDINNHAVQYDARLHLFLGVQRIVSSRLQQFVFAFRNARVLSIAFTLKRLSQRRGTTVVIKITVSLCFTSSTKTLLNNELKHLIHWVSYILHTGPIFLQEFHPIKAPPKLAQLIDIMQVK